VCLVKVETDWIEQVAKPIRTAAVSQTSRSRFRKVERSNSPSSASDRTPFLRMTHRAQSCSENRDTKGFGKGMEAEE